MRVIDRSELKGTGTRLRDKGYIQIVSRRSPYYMWREHRAVVDDLARMWNIYKGRDGRMFDEGRSLGLEDMQWNSGVEFVVHHMDFDKAHNCPQNLLVIDSRLHDGHSNCGVHRWVRRMRRRKGDERLDSVRGSTVPDWVID